MAIYYKPWYYTFSHVLTGFAAVWYPAIGIIALIYQIGQYLLDIRVFPVEMTIRTGNSLQHTGLKLSEITLGYSIGYIMKNMALNKV